MNKPLVTCAIFLAMTASVWADDVKITTYYPAPYGEYKELRGEKIIAGDPVGKTPVDPSDTVTVYGNMQVNSIVNIDSPKPPPGSPQGYYLRGKPIGGAGGGKMQHGRAGKAQLSYAPLTVTFPEPFSERPVLTLSLAQNPANFINSTTSFLPDTSLPVDVLFWRWDSGSGQVTSGIPGEGGPAGLLTTVTPTGFTIHPKGYGYYQIPEMNWVAVGN